MNDSERKARQLLSTHESDECLEWPGAKSSRGYGFITIDGKQILLTRFAKSLSEGIDIPHRTIVCRHVCDNPPCFNPRHLIWGSMADNMNDARERARMKRGGEHYAAKMTEKQVLEARSLFLEKKSLRHIQEVYGIMSTDTAERMLTGKTWAHVPGAISKATYRQITGSHMTPEQDAELIRLRDEEGASWDSLAMMFGYKYKAGARKRYLKVKENVA